MLLRFDPENRRQDVYSSGLVNLGQMRIGAGNRWEFVAGGYVRAVTDDESRAIQHELDRLNKEAL